MSTIIPGTTYGTAMPTYGTSYGGYAATPTYGGYGGYGTAAMDASTVETQLKDAQGVLSTQYGVQEEMQQQMAKAYGGAFGAGAAPAKAPAKAPAAKGKTPTKGKSPAKK